MATMETYPPIKQIGFLPLGNDQTNEMGDRVAELTDGRIIYLTPEKPSLHLREVPPEKRKRILWAD